MLRRADAKAEPIGRAEALALFAPCLPAMRQGAVLAVSGGPDSMAMLALAAMALEASGGEGGLFVGTVDHGLRAGARAEAELALREAARRGVAGRILTWSGPKPKTGIQARARAARYALLQGYAEEVGAGAIVTAHTAEDQAETVLLRLLHGSGPRGLAAIAPRQAFGDFVLLRPLLGIGKARLVATCEALDIPFAVDPSNENAAFERVRLRRMQPALERAGLTVARLGRLAARMQRQEAALEASSDRAQARCLALSAGRVSIDHDAWRREETEIRLRLLARALGHLRPAAVATLRLERLEALEARLSSGAGFRRATLGGCVVTLAGGAIGLVPEGERQRGRKRDTPYLSRQLGISSPAP